MRYITTLSFLFLLRTFSDGQGCVAIRSFTSCNPNAFTNSNLVGQGWQLSTSYRYFESWRHFRGDEEQVEREEEHTSVFNWVSQLNYALTYNFDKRCGISLVLPWTYNVRSSLYEHGGNSLGERHKTRSAGIGDIRLTYNYWLLPTDSARKGNVMLSAGVKLPTGNFKALDYFYNQVVEYRINNGGDTVGTLAGIYQPVDQSIQLGDGGFGFSLEMQGYYRIVRPLFVYVNGFYLFNPMEDNGVRTRSGDFMSIADQYMARLGFSWNVSQKRGLNLLCGGRVEGIPAKDLIGGSEGFRRPGYVVSVEPGIDWMFGRHDINVTAPIAKYRNRIQSVRDIERTEETGIFTNGDAAFADHVVNITWTVRLGGKSQTMTTPPLIPNVR